MQTDAEPDFARSLGCDLIGVRVSVWWEGDSKWYSGTVRDFSALGEHLILYDDGEQQQEILDECRCVMPLPTTPDAKSLTRVSGVQMAP